MTRLSCQMDHLPGACRYRDRGTRKMAGGKASTAIDLSSNCRRINRHVFAILRVLRKHQPPGVAHLNNSGAQGAAGGRASTPDVGPLDDGINLYILGPATGSAHAAARSHDEER
jgi:hypothetical protein